MTIIDDVPSLVCRVGGYLTYCLLIVVVLGMHGWVSCNACVIYHCLLNVFRDKLVYEMGRLREQVEMLGARLVSGYPGEH